MKAKLTVLVATIGSQSHALRDRPRRQCLYEARRTADHGHQRYNVRIDARALAEVIDAGHSIIVSHCNGPQAGLLALQTAACPLNVLDAECEGMIGYLIEQELRIHLGRDALIATLLTQTKSKPKDPLVMRTMAKCQWRGEPWSWRVARGSFTPRPSKNRA